MNKTHDLTNESINTKNPDEIKLKPSTYMTIWQVFPEALKFTRESEGLISAKWKCIQLRR